MTKTDTFLVRRLNAKGIEFHQNHFNPLDGEGKREKTIALPPTVDYLDGELSEEMPYEIKLPVWLPESKLAVARTLVRAFGPRFEQALYDAPMWNYLSLRWQNQLINEKRETRETASDRVHTAEEAYSSGAARIRQYRHRLWGPAFVYSRFGEISRVMLTGKINEMSDALEAFHFFGVLTKNVVTAVDAMYYDEETRENRGRNKQSKNLGGRLREGSVRDCCAQINQLAVTQALHLMTPEQIIDALPASEFGEYIEAARFKLGLHRRAA